MPVKMIQAGGGTTAEWQWRPSWGGGVRGVKRSSEQVKWVMKSSWRVRTRLAVFYNGPGYEQKMCKVLM